MVKTNERIEVFDFVGTAGKLKKVERKGWIAQAGVENPESVADHSFRTALLAMCIGDLKGLNVEKLVRMALLHDLHEALTGDYDLADKERIGDAVIRGQEREAIDRLYSSLPEGLREKYRLLSLEFQMQDTAEARLVKDIDRLEMVFQALEYQEEGYDEGKLETFWNFAKEKIEDLEVKRLFSILDEKRKAS